MCKKYLISSFSVLFPLLAMNVFAQEDNCQINISDTGVKIDVVSIKKKGNDSIVKLNYNNTSENDYDITGVNVKSCQHYGGEFELPEMKLIGAKYDQMTQEYLCDSSFNKNDIHVKLYMKEYGQEIAVAACDAVKARK